MSTEPNRRWRPDVRYFGVTTNRSRTGAPACGNVAFDMLTAEARDKVLKRNCERIFDEGRQNARAWEEAHRVK